MTKHTPGPWKMKERATYVLTDPGVDVLDDCWIEILGDTRNPIATLPCGSIYDANLIAAAPDLLQALQDMILMTHRGSVVHFLSTEQESVLAEAEAIVEKVVKEVK